MFPNGEALSSELPGLCTWLRLTLSNGFGKGLISQLPMAMDNLSTASPHRPSP